MLRASSDRVLFAVLVFVLLGIPARLPAQQQPPPTPVTQEHLTTYAKAYAAIGVLLEQVHAELAKAQNKTAEAQKQLRENLKQNTTKILRDHGLTDEQYAHITYVISTDPERRTAFEELLAQLAPKK
jgi:hypothetical protein